MKLIDLEKHRKVKIGFEGVAELILSNYETAEICINANAQELKEERTLDLELMIPANSSYYAALGAKYVPLTGQKDLCIEVRYAEGAENYSATLAYDKKSVFKGLPQEYLDTVLKTSMSYLSDGQIPCGKIVFNSAAYCEVGSSPVMFRVATKIVLEALLSEHFPISESDIRAICEKHLAERVGV